MKSEKINIPNGLTAFHVGPPLSDQKLPAFIYFALSGEESLELDPYNQPIKPLLAFPIHVFSFTLPGHGPGFDKNLAMNFWAQEMHKNGKFISNFIRSSMVSINFLINANYIDPAYIATGGLSRGAFIAAHLAANFDKIGSLIGFAPLTEISKLTEFENENINNIKNLNVSMLAPLLAKKKVRFYIGNHDTRVSTDECYYCIKKITEAAYESGQRSPPVELIISPSIGLKGHGTPPHVFQDGAYWIIKILGKNYEI